MTDFPLTGGCNCGAVRFEVTGPLVIASYCHCKRCQRRSGAAASANAHPASDTFRIVAGEDRLRVWKPDGGGENGSAATVDRRSLAATQTTPIRLAFAWERSTAIPGSERASASSWPTQRLGSRSQTTGCPVTPRVATPSGSPARAAKRMSGSLACGTGGRANPLGYAGTPSPVASTARAAPGPGMPLTPPPRRAPAPASHTLAAAVSTPQRPTSVSTSANGHDRSR
jgi:Glutathione-dependent formaldehyde-activating enzyme